MEFYLTVPNPKKEGNCQLIYEILKDTFSKFYQVRLKIFEKNSARLPLNRKVRIHFSRRIIYWQNYIHTY